MATTRLPRLRVLQTNVNTARLAHDLAVGFAATGDFDVLVAAEPNPTLVRSRGWFVDSLGGVGVFIRNRQLRIHGIESHWGFVNVRFENMSFLCCYISPNITAEEYGRRLDEIVGVIIGERRGEVLVIGDLNAKSAAWGSPVTDARGQMDGWTVWGLWIW
ncbi:uncharacterized protein [Diabrotica undecimpunctata]|uniref:uncharacterized protein n=1 Tax=Diabrotica undecimpunctata TaxID=50387 RepID=UPI003B63C083